MIILRCSLRAALFTLMLRDACCLPPVAIILLMLFRHYCFFFRFCCYAAAIDYYRCYFRCCRHATLRAMVFIAYAMMPAMPLLLLIR